MYEKLKKNRKKEKYTIKDMSEKLMISKAYYSQIENGKKKLSYPMAISIASIFNKKPDQIFYEDYQKRNGVILPK